MLTNDHDDDAMKRVSLIMVGLIALIAIYTFIGNLLEHFHFHYIHETGVGIIIGAIFGAFAWIIEEKNVFGFSEEIFMYALLPPMIFAGGYNLKKKNFFQNFSYISLYGVLGTLVTFGIIFGLTVLINHLEWIVDYSDWKQPFSISIGLIIKYSATICASDSVAALTMIKPNKYPKLFSIVFGEGMINDAVAIILFKVVGDIFDDPPDGSAPIILLTIFWKFLSNIGISLLIGAGCALMCSFIFKKARFLSKNPVAEVTLLYMFGIISYMFAEIFELSGVITVLVCGIFLAHFNFYNLSITGQISTGVTFQTISFIAEAFVFIYLGISSISYFKEYKFSLSFVLLELFICAFARFLTIFCLSYLVKTCMKKWNVSFYELLIISFAGVIRGSVAFALILTLKPTEKKGESEESVRMFQSSVMLMVFITTILLGASMPTFITTCLSKDKTQGELRQSLIEKKEKKQSKELKGFGKFDEEILKPTFIYDYKERQHEIKEFKKLLKLNSPEYKGGEFTGLINANARQTIIPDSQITTSETGMSPVILEEEDYD